MNSENPVTGQGQDLKSFSKIVGKAIYLPYRRGPGLPTDINVRAVLCWFMGA